MKDDVFELVEVDDGQIVLKRPDDPSALIKIDIGSDMANQLSIPTMEFVRAMLEAGFSEAAQYEEDHSTLVRETLSEEKVFH